MTLQQLQQVITIADSKSMNEAAKKLYVSQPNLSAVVKELEAEAGISIFTEMGDSLKRISERTGVAALTTQLAGRGSCSASKSAYGT